MPAMVAEGLWELVACSWEGIELRARRACTARELAADLLPSKVAASRALARGRLVRAGEALAHDAQIAPGDTLTLAFNREDGVRMAADAAAAPLEVLYCDPALLVVDKPAGLLVHGDGRGGDTLTARVEAWLAREGHRVRPQAVQRLDVDTTGLVLFSLTEEFQAALDAQVAGHAMGKRYVALTRRAPRGAEKGWVELAGPIARDRHDARRMRVGARGKAALTRVRERARAGGLSLLEVELATGRKHQIRVHLAHEGCPIVGDALYGQARGGEPLMLHAWQEQVVHPLTGERLAFRTAWPRRFASHFAEID